MRSRIFLLALLLAPAFVLAQNILDSRTANVLPLWKKGDRFVYSVTTSERKFKSGTLDESSASSFKLTYSVLDTTGGLRMEQRMSDFSVQENKHSEPLTKEEQALFDRLLEMHTAVPIIYTCTSDGTVEGLENTEQVITGMRKFIGEVMRLFPEDGTREMMTALVEQMLTPDAIASSALEHAQNLHILHGGGYSVGERFENDVELPNLLGGDPIPGKITVVMNSLDARTGKALFTITVRIDSAKLQAIVKDLVARMVTAAGGTMDAKTEREMTDAFSSMKMTDTYNITMDINGANISKMSYKREMTVGPNRQLNIQEYQLVR